MIEFALLTSGIIYCAVILFFFIGVLRERRNAPSRNGAQPFVSVLVPARNEADHILPILKSLSEQSYPSDRFEVLIIDDHSTDDTGCVVQQFIEKQQLVNFQLLTHRNDGTRPTYKKNAITYAMQFTRGEIILTTDADCRVQADWIRMMARCYDAQTGLVAGLITFEKAAEKRLFHKLQTLEFAGLVFTGVGAIGNQYPLICNGSNLSYRRAAYDEIGGFEGHEHIPSGDDDLFMQNLHHFTKWKIHYNLEPSSINFTQPVDTLRQFLNQRARWASKSRSYPDVKTFLLLLSIYAFYLLLLFSPALLWLKWISFPSLLIALTLKIVPEFAVISQALAILQRRDLLRYFPLAEVAQIPYIVLAGFAGFFKLFKWK